MVYGGKRHAKKMRTGQVPTAKLKHQVRQQFKSQPAGDNQDHGRTPSYKSKGNFKKRNHDFNKSKYKNPRKREDGDYMEVSEDPGPMFDGDNKSDSESDMETNDTRRLVMQANRKNKKSGGFQSMGLSHNVYKGVFRKGYKMPTPIQRKTIPLIMDGKDVVAMARTGSGKTAAFLIPLFERLKTHTPGGARALILSPTRELAMQTLKFTKELGRFTGLRAAVLLGGDSLSEQFAALHAQPDVMVATPGRFVHLCVQMELKLTAVEYVVFDEADRLFEMGFQEQLTDILQRLPEARQTLLFSATLPRLLVEFTRAGLHDPTLVRLDVEAKLSENLRMSYFHCRAEDKTAVLLYLLRHVVRPSEQTVIFAATKHHVEYLNMLLTEAGMSVSYSYSSLDQTARKINVAKFRNKVSMVLVVTDIAARGIDIPLLDNVINYSFPAKPKLFVHRVGRVARAGRSGTAYSLVTSEEMPYLVDLTVFLGNSLQCARAESAVTENALLGAVPQSVVDEEDENLRAWHAKHDLATMLKVVAKAQSQYVKSRPAPASESIRRAKELSDVTIAPHPLFRRTENSEEEKLKFLTALKSFKPQNTIFEINSTSKTQASLVMRKKRNIHGDTIIANQKRAEERVANHEKRIVEDQSKVEDQVDNEDLKDAFTKVIAPKRNEKEFKSKKRRKTTQRDEENYVQYRPKDYQSEKGLSLGSSGFEQEVATAEMDMAGDDENMTRSFKNQVKWDRKKKKFVGDKGNNPKNKKIRTETGAMIPASYKSNAYRDWLKKTKKDEDSGDEEAPAGKVDYRRGRARFRHNMNRGKPPAALPQLPKKSRSELKPKEQIIKERKVKAQKKSFQVHRARVNAKRSKKSKR